MKKRITSLLLVFVMLLSMVPTAFAEDLGSSRTRTISGMIDDSTVWSYVDDGSVTDTDWNTANYNDSGWKIGAGPFGSAETVTNISAGTVLDGCTGEDNVATYFFRTQFRVEETSDITSLVGALEYDDAAIIYLNGTKIYEGKQNGNVSGFGYAGTDKAAQRAESLVINDVDALNALQAGVNTVAVEVHNSSATDTDVWFHMNLKASDGKQEKIDEFTVWSWFGAPINGEHVDPAGDSTAVGYNRLIWTEPTYEEKDWVTGVGPFCSQGKGQIYQNVSPVEIAPTLLVGTDRKNNSPAYFFRTELYLTRETLSNLESIKGRLCFDDAVVVYINGAKVYEGANSTNNTPITSNLQYAGGGNPVSKEFSVTDFSNLNLHVGNNTVAVELHQDTKTGNDIWLDFEMDTVVGVRTAIDDDSVWSYVSAESLSDDANWTDANYDDGSWNVGKGAFSSAATLNSVAANTVLPGFGEGKDVTYYFRTQFTVPKGEKEDIKSLVGVLEYDDSATIYLNGTEIYEGKENGRDTGTQHAEVLLFDSDEVLNLLQEGANTVAVAMRDKKQEEHDGWFHLNLAPHDGTQEKLDHTSIWTYLDNDTDPAVTPGTEKYERTSWTEAGFDDSTWSKGIAPFGYQNSHKSSVYKNVNPPEVGATELKFKGSDGKNNVHAYFFRTDLYIEDLEKVGSLNGWISCDDAAIVYINGIKVYEWTKDAVNGNLDYASGPAGNPSPTAFKVTDLADLNLKRGSNAVAIELHQDRADGGDIWLDFTLEPSEERAEHLSNIVMNPGPDETQMYFTWYADVEKDGYVALAKYDTIVDGKMPEDAVKQVATVKKATDGNYNYKVTAQNLEKGVKYAYQVVSGNYKSDIYSFTTGSGKTDFSFGFVADIQIVGSNNTKWADSLNKMVKKFPNQSFLLSAGDQVNTNNSEVEYDHLLDLEQMRSLPFAPVVGNHDRNNIYQEHFTQPNLSAQYGITPGGADAYFVYNGVLFLLINAHAASSPAEEHKAFIQQAIEETKDQDIKWKVVCMHSSFYSNVTDNASLGHDRHNLRTTFMPVFQELGIDVVFSGHDHIYARSYMLDGVDQKDTDAVYTYDTNNVPVSVSNSDGVLYVAGSSPGNRCNAMAEKLEWVAVQGVDKRQNISNVTVTDTTFNITTYYTEDMSVLDTFTIHKGVEQTDIALNMGADETEMNITWYSNAAGTGTVKLAKQSDLVGNAMPESAKTFSATGVASSQTGYNSYQTTMTVLEPDTTYAYQLVNGEKASDIYTFTTGGAGVFSFAYVGDPQIGAGKISTDTAGWDKTLNIIEDHKNFDGVSFMLSAGDQVNTANNEEQYDGYLNHETLKSLPMATVIGNHDTKNGMANYSEHFNVANESSTQGVTDAGGDSYFVYNNTLFMVLNTNNLSAAEHKDFMEAAINATKDQDIRWKIVTFHHSIYTVASHYHNDKTDRRETLAPIFDDLDIDVVLQGHDHVYCRTYMMDGVQVSQNENYTYGNGADKAPTAVTNPEGVLYVTANSASGSKHYAIQNMEFLYSAVQNQEKVPNVSKVTVSDTQFTITTYRTTDMSVVDTFTINKTAQQAEEPAKLIIDQVYGNGGKDETPIANSFVELYNPNNQSVCLAGYTLTYGEKILALDGSKSIPANGSYLIVCAAANTSDNFQTYELPEADQTCDWTIDNKAYTVELKKGDTILDRVTAGKGETTKVSKQKSLQRVDHADTDTDSDFRIVVWEKGEMTADENTLSQYAPHNSKGAYGKLIAEEADESVTINTTSDTGLVKYLSSYSTGNTNADGGVAEIVKFNEENDCMYLVSGQTQTLDIVKVNADGSTTLVKKVDIASLGDANGFSAGDITSVDVNTDRNLVAIAVQNADFTANGVIVTLDYEGNFLAKYEAGVQPDMLTFSPDGNLILSANEGEPRDGYGEGATDPMGSVSVVDLTTGNATTYTFESLDSSRETLIANGVLLKKNTAPSADLEPEFIAVSADSKTAYVTLQENNAVAALDLTSGTWKYVKGLGFKDHSAEGNGLDLDVDSKIDIRNENVYGVYMPDGISVVTIGGQDYLITANEGDAREWGKGDNEYANTDSATLTLSDGAEAGKKIEYLDTSKTDGLKSGKTYILGGRSFSIWDADTLEQVFDSGDDFEQITAREFPEYFNSGHDEAGLDKRSHKKGVEPESVSVLETNGKVYAIVGLERMGGIMVYDISNPANAKYTDYLNVRNFKTDDLTKAGDLGPEGICTILAEDSPTGNAMILVANEISGTVTVAQIEKTAADKDDDDSGSSGGSSSGGGAVSVSYAIAVEDSINGTVITDRTRASYGSTVTLTVTPDTGYTLETLTVTTASGKEVELTNKGDGKYTFKMPGSKVAVKATFMDDNTMMNSFVDVSVDAYYYDAVLWAAENGITSGTTAITFSPDNLCTRAQMATFLWRAAGSPDPVGSSNPFVDVAADAYYAKAVQWAYEKGITGGTSATTFSPDQTCTRAQMATFLWHNAGSPETLNTTNPFADVPVNVYYATAVQWAYDNGITSGTNATAFSPNASCTRAQMVTFLYRCFAAK